MNNIDTNTLINVGIILKLEKAQAFVMTDKLEFVELKRTQDMTRGQKVFFDETDLYVPESIIKNKSFVKTFSIVASAAAVFLVIFYSLGLNFFTNHFTYVSVDINPSLELAINRKNIVVESKPLNNEAKLLLENIVVEKLPVKDAIKNILDISKKEGFLDDANNSVLFSVTPESENDAGVDNILNSLKEVTETEGLHSEVIKATSDNRKIASEYGLSMGKYAVYTKANEKGLNITIEEIKNSRVSQILDKIKIVDPNFFSSDTEVHVAQASASSTPIVEATPSVKVADSSNAPSAVPSSIKASSSVKTPAPPSSGASSLPEATAAANNSSALPGVIPSATPVVSPLVKSTPIPYPTNRVIVTTMHTPKATPSPIHTSLVAVAPTPYPTSAPSYQASPKRTRSATVKPHTPTPLPVYTATPVRTSVPTPAPTNVPTATSVRTPVPTITPIRTPTPVPTPVPTQTPKYTSTNVPAKTPVPTATATATVTPKPTVAPTNTPFVPTPTAVAQPTSENTIGEIKLQMYNENTTPTTNYIQPRIKLVNTGTTPINIIDIKVRYYFTIDEVKYPLFDPDWVAIDNKAIDKSNIKCKFVKMSESTDNADYYAELSFADAGKIQPGKHLTTVFRITPDHKRESTQFDQLSDYSFNNSALSPSDWNKVTVYISGKLVSGIEP
ncbi:MAG: anti-sigma factor domain-containing protein [Clostridiaceae bacterium]|nr:anti-sigma factor domain-containing protein [Clostridiaceae bacterium]